MLWFIVKNYRIFWYRIIYSESLICWYKQISSLNEVYSISEPVKWKHLPVLRIIHWLISVSLKMIYAKFCSNSLSLYDNFIIIYSLKACKNCMRWLQKIINQSKWYDWTNFYVSVGAKWIKYKIILILLASLKFISTPRCFKAKT